MKTANQLLDEVKSRHGIQSDYKLALYLGVAQGSVQNWRHGRSMPDETACEKIAAALGLDADVLIAEMNRQRARTPQSKATWERISGRLQGSLQAGSATIVGMVIVALLSLAASITFHPSAHATATARETQQSTHRMFTTTSLKGVVLRFLRRLRRRASPAWAHLAGAA